MRTYRLLTGATGLLGRYLLRDLMLQEEPVAVLVRPSRWEMPEQRVDQILSFWDEQWGRSLPRPVVLQGDITEPLLGLDGAQIAWARRHCRSVLHSAASLSFQEEEGEPYRSNVDGVRNVLEFCRSTGVKALDHVSTSYVCGLRLGDRVRIGTRRWASHGKRLREEQTRGRAPGAVGQAPGSLPHLPPKHHYR